MQLACQLMYEMAMRRQDAVQLTFKHFINPENVSGEGYIVKFKCTKQGKSRVIEIPQAAR